MTKDRLVAFSDGVFAIILTIMVLELKVPRGADFAALCPLFPVFLSYVLSFVNVGIYWNNHHHMLYATKRVDGAVLWANLHLLFWLSLIPFLTGWMGENHFAPIPTALYGVTMLMAGVGYWILQRAIIPTEGNHLLAEAVGNANKEKVSIVAYLVAILLAFVSPLISDAIFVLVAVMWLVPDRRIEETVAEESKGDGSEKPD